MMEIWPSQHLWPDAENWKRFYGDAPRRCLRCDIRENHAFAVEPCGWISPPWLRMCEGCGRAISQRQATIVRRLFFTCKLCGHVNYCKQ